MEWQIVNAIAALLLPPGCLVVVGAAGVLTARRRPRLGRALIAFSLVALYALATPCVAYLLARALEPPFRDPLAERGGRAIVVLGGGTYYSAPEYGRDTVGLHTLARVRYAARLHRATAVPILASGGSPLGRASTEAEHMAQALASDFNVPVKWVEKASRNTLENARLSSAVLSAAGIRRIYLVTQAWHAPRARLAFEHAGFSVILAPTEYATRGPLTVVDFLPSASALNGSSRVFHEVIGIGWYHLRMALGR